MKLAGFFLLLTGWALVLVTLALLGPGVARTCFVLAGVGVEVVGLVLIIRSQPLPRTGRG